MTAAIRLGTCAWIDPGLVGTWYPTTAKSAAARLRFYAEHYDVVEVNSSYYALPSARNAALWADRTPDGFVFHVKAFGLMTGHRVRPDQLPEDLRDRVRRVTARGNVEPDADLRRRVFERFHQELEPLREAGRLGQILMQYPPGFRPSEESFAELAEARELLGGDAMLVEFRQRDWLAEERRDEVLDFLEEHGMTYVCVDAPPVEAANVLPTLVTATTDTGYARFHGRNVATWNARGSSASERFDHLYDTDELAEWVEPLRAMSRATSRIYAMFNTNNLDQGPRNAERLRGLLEAARVPVVAPPGPAVGGQEALF